MEIKLAKYLFAVLLLICPNFAQDLIVGLHPKGKQFESVIKSLRETLGGELKVQNIEIEKDSEWKDITAKLEGVNPKAFVLLDNKSISIYKQYIASLPEGSTPIPAIATMALQLEKVAEGLPLLGISYEIPVVTSVVNLRPISKDPIAKVGVVYRTSMADFIAQNKEFCATESVELVGFEIDTDDPDDAAKELKKALKAVFKEEVNALWVVNDNILVNGKSLVKSWIPMLKKEKIPVIVGVESLIETKLKMGNFAVLPDNVALGTQAAEMVFELMDNDWVVEETRIDQPLSVIKTLNRTLADKNGFLNEDGLSTIDKEVE